MRDRSIDLTKGMAILFIYFAHSILYHPIDMKSMYSWCFFVDKIITSFTLPMFFFVSGYLFSKTSKSSVQLYKGKTQRLFFPYLTTMFILIAVKLVLPLEMSSNKAVMGGVISMINDALFYGGDRWFVYTLFLIFLILIPLRKRLDNKLLSLGMIVVLAIIVLKDYMPQFMLLDHVCYYMVFFLSGYIIKEFYLEIKQWSLKNKWYPYAIFILFNLAIDMFIDKKSFLFLFVLPITGTWAIMTLAFQLEKTIDKNVIARYIEYCGKYSLQFYLFTFCYPIIRYVTVLVLHITNPFVIIAMVFVLQLITITVFVEVTRRIKWLKIPCGY